MTDFDYTPNMDGLEAQEGLFDSVSPLLGELLASDVELPRTAALASAYLRKGQMSYDQAGAHHNACYNDGDTYHVAVVVEVSKYSSPELFDKLTKVDNELVDRKREMKRQALSAEAYELQHKLNQKLKELNNL